MIEAVALILAVSQVQITGVRPVSDSNRIVGRDVAFRCDLPVDGVPTTMVYVLDGEIAGTGDGPLTLQNYQGSPIGQFKSLPGSVTFDETKPIESRVLAVSLGNKLKMGAKKYFARLKFRYRPEGSAPNSIHRADRIDDATLSVFGAGDMKSSVVGYIEKSRDVQPLVKVGCDAMLMAEATTGIEE